jgi:hypothetical protein
MKLSTIKIWVFVTFLTTGGFSTSGLIQAQTPNRQVDAPDRDEQVRQTIVRTLQTGAEQQPTKNSPWYWGGSATYSGGRSGPNPSSAIRKAAEAVRDAKGEEAKSAAQKKLTELLGKFYDDDMVQREHELKQIEERLAKLRELLDRRRTKKQEIIDLQTKVALNEAEGLGFYDSDRPAKGGASSFSLPTPHVEINPPGVNDPHSNSTASPASPYFKQGH